VPGGTNGVNHLEDAIVEAGGAALRCGTLYGKGANANQVEMVRKRMFPLVGRSRLGTAPPLVAPRLQGRICMTRAEEFEQVRPLLFSIAYRVLGSVSEAEDAVQETWLRYEACTTHPTSLKAFLAATVTGISIDLLRSARSRRESYVGPWFPEPLLDDPYEDPERSAELADSLSMAALLLLERLTPLMRAVFVLREIFGFDFSDVASAVGRSEAACRQLSARAPTSWAAGRTRFQADRQEREELAARFFSALKDGDVDGLKDLIAADAQLVADAAGKAPALARSVFGAEKVARALASVYPRLLGVDVRVDLRPLNGQSGAVLRDRDGKVLFTMTLAVLDGQIQPVRSVNNPDRLAHLGPVADAWAVAREMDQARPARSTPGRSDGQGHRGRRMPLAIPHLLGLDTYSSAAPLKAAAPAGAA
jgi:RNA polymerase sigma-70 factor, ECF subfamily